MKTILILWSALLLSVPALAAPARYVIDPEHTFPSFEADHMGVSLWRGKFNRSSGEVMLDKAGKQGTVNVLIDLSSVDFGHDKLNKWAIGADLFDIAHYPQARYQGALTHFVDGQPTMVSGNLTLHGVTKPVNLTVNSFKCIPHPLSKRDLCGADAVAVFQRDAFGLAAGKSYGFNMDVTLRIQVEAVEAEK